MAETQHRFPGLRSVMGDISEELYRQFRSAEKIDHAGDRGEEREIFLADFLRGGHMPTRYTVSKGRGKVISHNGVYSKQTDIVIYDAGYCPVLRDGKNHQFFPIESVFSAIQVKSRLSTNSLVDAAENIASVKRLAAYDKLSARQHFGGGMFVAGPGEVRPAPYGVVFAYALSEGVSLKSIITKLAKINEARPPAEWVNAVCVLGVAHLTISFKDAGHYRVLDSREIRKLATDGHTPTIGSNVAPADALLDFYLCLVGTLNGMELRPPKLDNYLDLPQSDGVNYFHTYPRPGATLVCQTCGAEQPALVLEPWPARLREFFSHEPVGHPPQALLDMSDLRDLTGEGPRTVLGEMFFLYAEDGDARTVDEFRTTLLALWNGSANVQLVMFNGAVVAIPLDYLKSAPLMPTCDHNVPE